MKQEIELLDIKIKEANTLISKHKEAIKNATEWLSSCDMARMFALQVQSKQATLSEPKFAYYKNLVRGASGGDNYDLDAIKQELGYDTILKDWNIERERANIDIKERNARILTIENWLEANKQRTIQKEIAKTILEYLKAGDCDKETLRTADAFINDLGKGS